MLTIRSFLSLLKSMFIESPSDIFEFIIKRENPQIIYKEAINADKGEYKYQINIYYGETLNEEEIAADCTISDTFQKMMVKSSPNIFQLVFRKIKHHVQTRILEPAVSNKIVLKSTRRMSDVKLKYFR